MCANELKERPNWGQQWLLAGLLCVGLIALAFPLRATTLVQDDFPEDGPLAGQTPAVGSTWTGTTPYIQVNAGAVMLTSSYNSASTSFAAQSSTTIYAGFEFVVTQAPASSGTFIFSFLNGSQYVGRLFIVHGDSASTFRAGIENSLDNPIYWGGYLNVNTPYRAVVALTENGLLDSSTLWIDPVQLASPSVSDTSESFLSSFDGIVLRGQSDLGTTAQIRDLYVGTDFYQAAAVPEPGTAILLLPAGLALLFRRRKRAD